MKATTSEVPSDFQDVLKTLFGEAEKNGGLDYIFTLLRVTGITRSKDALIELESALSDQDLALPSEEPAVQSCLFNGIEESLTIMGNLLNCSAGTAYRHCFFFSLYKGSFPNIIKPSVGQMLKEVHNHATEKDNPGIANLLDQACLASLTDEEASKSTEQQLGARLFLQDLIDVYKSERLKFKDRPRFCKLPRFEVLELMVNEVEGLYGFHLHFSNGSSAHFIRLADSTEPLNIRFDRESELVAFVGDLDALTEEWRVGDRKLYEIGLPGRYNKLGEWKPLVYPERKSDVTDRLQQKAISLSNDEVVRGVLFYIMCTAHQVIEFVVKADIELPWEDTTFGKALHLWKCPNSAIAQNFFIYDGTYYLESFDPDEIETAISAIGVTLNMIAFAYNGTLRWRVKYNIVNRSHTSSSKIEESDLDVLNSMLEKYPRNRDGLILNSAVDWYNRGVAARDAFAGFLCYYRAIEMIATSVYSGKASFGLGFQKSTKAEAKQRSLGCIEQKYNHLYHKDKLRFVTSAYAECIQGARVRTEQVLQLVFGQDSRYIKDLVGNDEGERPPSLYQIRNKIAHGNLTLLNKDDVELVRSRLSDAKRISKELIMRLSCSLKSSDELPKWSGVRTMAMSGCDPRTYLVANTEGCFPADVDWRIKPEWCV